MACIFKCSEMELDDIEDDTILNQVVKLIFSGCMMQ